jgi:hypothetical protein
MPCNAVRGSSVPRDSVSDNPMPAADPVSGNSVSACVPTDAAVVKPVRCMPCVSA